MQRVLATETPALRAAAVREAAELLRRGEIIGIPTETVYGLAANAFNEQAVGKIFAVKGRPAHNPLIVHVGSLKMARRCVSAWPDVAEKLAAAFWPGPLTLVLPRSREIPDNVTAGGSTVAVRWPRHPFVQALIEACDFPLAAPSANRSGEVSPTTAEHVQKVLGNRIPLIVDGGPAQIGIESTVIDATAKPPRLLRPGMIHSESLIAVIDNLDESTGQPGELPRSPGQLLKHYSPKAKLLVWQWLDEADLANRVAAFDSRTAPDKVHVIAHTVIPIGLQGRRVSIIPHDAEAFGRALYAELHRCDDVGAEVIIVEKPPPTAEWRAIADRLQRAAAD